MVTTKTPPPPEEVEDEEVDDLDDRIAAAVAKALEGKLPAPAAPKDAPVTDPPAPVTIKQIEDAARAAVEDAMGPLREALEEKTTKKPTTKPKVEPEPTPTISSGSKLKKWMWGED